MKIRLIVEYCGGAFSGWQAQPGVRTVQGELERALGVYLCSLAKRAGCPLPATPKVVGSGRTDAGVHARGQVASFAWPEGLPCYTRRLGQALNAITVPELVVHQVAQASDDFDARLSPHMKCYTYRLLLRQGREGWWQDRVWVIRPDVDIVKMIGAARCFRGQHDFHSFRAQDCTSKSSVRTVLTSELTRRSDELIVYTAHGTGFLKQMIRIIVGTIVEVGEGRKSVDEIGAIFAARDRSRAGRTAPPQGLTLEWVRYLDVPYYLE